MDTKNRSFNQKTSFYVDPKKHSPCIKGEFGYYDATPFIRNGKISKTYYSCEGL